MINAISPIIQQTYKRKPAKNNTGKNLQFTRHKFSPIQQINYTNYYPIYFKGKLNSLELEKTTKENNIPLQSQTLDFVLSIPNEQNYDKYLKYSKTGSKFFELYSRYLLHKKYPIKDEGELTNIIPDIIKDNNKTRILSDIVPTYLMPKAKDKSSTQEIHANCLNAFLGAIIYENKDGFKTAFKFIDTSIGENILPENLKISQSAIEELEQEIRKQGKSWQDVYQETRYFNEQWHYRIHYKDIILSQAHGGKHNHALRELCAKEALDKIQSGEIDLDSAGNKLIYTNYKKPTPFRIKKLEEFAKKYNLKFEDISLLHKVFLYGEMQDCSALAHSDTYEILEFIGDAVLGFCTHEILQDNLPYATRDEICSKRHAFVKNRNLSTVAKEMGLDSYIMNRNKKRGEKRTADIFEALIGAIFLNGKEDGIDNVYKFLDNNFRDKILNIETN